MTEERLDELFAEGTVPERDAAFVRRVTAQVGRERLALRLLALTLRALAFATLAGAVFVTVRTIEPMLRPIAESAPQFMGVPLPLVMSALVLGLALYAWRLVRLRLR